MDYSTLKSRVQSAMGRSDVPDYVYELATADINRDLRSLDMQATTTLSVSTESTSLPADFLEAINAYVDATPRGVMQPVTDAALDIRHDSEGQPFYYSVVDGALLVMPVPDATYSVFLRYSAKLADLSGDTDTNDIMTTYPGLYLYGSLQHAAIWAQDEKLATVYSAAYGGEIRKAVKSDLKRRMGGRMVQRPIRGGF